MLAMRSVENYKWSIATPQDAERLLSVPNGPEEELRRPLRELSI